MFNGIKRLLGRDFPKTAQPETTAEIADTAETTYIPIQDIRILFSPFIPKLGKNIHPNPLEDALSNVKKLLIHQRNIVADGRHKGNWETETKKIERCEAVSEALERLLRPSLDNPRNSQMNVKVLLTDLNILSDDIDVFSKIRGELDTKNNFITFRENLNDFLKRRGSPIDHSRHTVPTASTPGSNAPGLPGGMR